MKTFRTAAATAVLATAALLAVAGCSREADKASRSLADDSTVAAAPQSGVERVSRRYDEDRPAAAGRAYRYDSGAASSSDPGSYGWASSRRGSPDENARRQFDRNGSDFSAASVQDYAAKAQAFAASPPKGALTTVRSNGDKLYYDPRSNTFLVTDRKGAPRTMFKPRQGRAYWTQQQQEPV